MRILLTNHTLGRREGTEMYIRDIALALLARGHEPIAYSRTLGEVAEELRRATVPVLDDLEALCRPPDLIHAQHHLEAMTALTCFPSTPVVYFCHGWLPPEEAPPRHPRIHRYVAVDALVRQRLLDECGIPETRVETLLNFVDLDRFRPRTPLPAQAARALVFSNHVGEENCLPILRAACQKVGLALDAVGRSVGRTSACPEELLGGYDVVFAKGRSALEAVAVGAAVILCDLSGLGPMVTSGELARIRSLNFGVRLLREPVAVEAVVKQLERYDAVDATEVTSRLRREVGIQTTVDRLIDVYTEIVAEHSHSSLCETEEARATSRYLRWGPLTAGDFFQNERLRLQVEAARADEMIRGLRERLTRVTGERADFEEKWTVTDSERQHLAVALAEMTAEARAEARRLVEAEARWEIEARRQAEHLEARVEQVTNLRRELNWITSSATWRWRQRIANHRWLTTAYRALFARKRED